MKDQGTGSRPDRRSETGVAVDPHSGAAGAVLFVDDDLPIRTVAGAMFERMGRKAIMAADGSQAVILFRRHRAEISAVILDLMMPNHDGTAALAAIRALDDRVPLIIMSGLSGETVTSRTGVHRADRFLPKPFTLESLRTCLAAVESA
jgi:two-component system, cell cycle sensor histidine kinase and response regulator CckA